MLWFRKREPVANRGLRTWQAERDADQQQDGAGLSNEWPHTRIVSSLVGIGCVRRRRTQRLVDEGRFGERPEDLDFFVDNRLGHR